MAADVYIEFEGSFVKGDTEDETQKDQIELLSWSHGFMQPSKPARSTSGTASTGKVNHQDFSFTKMADASSIHLLKACWGGNHFPKAVMKAFRASGNTASVRELYLSITMEDVVITSVQMSTGGDLPVESISMTYGKLTYEYYQQKPKDGATAGNAKALHNLETNTVS